MVPLIYAGVLALGFGIGYGAVSLVRELTTEEAEDRFEPPTEDELQVLAQQAEVNTHERAVAYFREQAPTFRMWGEYVLEHNRPHPDALDRSASLEQSAESSIPGMYGRVMTNYEETTAPIRREGPNTELEALASMWFSCPL